MPSKTDRKRAAAAPQRRACDTSVDDSGLPAASPSPAGVPGGRTFLEFFCGGGTARLGLGEGWTCALANDIDPLKASVYRDNFGDGDLVEADVRDIDPAALEGPVDLAWASFPCTDLSLAGARNGLDGTRSGAFWPFWDIVRRLADGGRAPRTVVLENVPGLLNSDGGRDFAAICGSLSSTGYRLGALVVDAALFLPQSRERVFIVGVRDGVAVPDGLVSPEPCSPWSPKPLVAAVAKLPPPVRDRWVWWRMPVPARLPEPLDGFMDRDLPGSAWHPPEVTADLLAKMPHLDRERLAAANATGTPVYGAVTVRTGHHPVLLKNRCANVSFSGLMPCILLPRSGVVARSTVMLVEGGTVRTRSLTVTEGMRLMGLPPHFRLPRAYNAAFKVLGDAMVVPVVRHLAERLVEPLADAARATPGCTASRRHGTSAVGGEAAEAGPDNSARPEKTGARRKRSLPTASRGIKDATVKSTVYLLPEENLRARQLALSLRKSLHTLLLDGLDRVMAGAGQKPVRRYENGNGRGKRR